MAGLVQVTLHTIVRKIPGKTKTLNNFHVAFLPRRQQAVKEATRLVSTSSKQLGQQKYQYQTPPNKVKKTPRASSDATSAGKRIDSVAASLASKGFLRPRNAYQPPKDVSQRVKEIFGVLKIPTDVSLSQNLLENKFAILRACSDSFSHAIPNSQIHEINTIGDIVEFYQTPVDTITPLDALQRTQLPENLHIQYDYVRFNPATDSMFGGKSAYPKSSTLVTGLKYRSKYDGHIAKRSWP